MNSDNNPNHVILKTLLIISLLYILYIVYKKYLIYNEPHEGFTQSRPFVIKHGQDIFDEFYCDIYDELHRPQHRIAHELINVINSTEPNTRNSTFLDIGSGTGHIVKELHEAGYRAFGIDKSQAMVDYADEKFPSCNFQCGDATEPMQFDKGTFSHILCTYFTIYLFEDKLSLFRNCYQWLKPNGYMILHLVNPDKFDTLSPAAKSNLVVNPHRFETTRIINSIVNFKDFQYKLMYDYKMLNQEKLVMTERFKDNVSGHIRENELILHTNPVDKIVELAKRTGFIVHALFDMKDELDDEHQFIYILERI